MSIIETLLIIFGLLNLAFAGFLYIHSDKKPMVTSYALISFFASLWSLSTLFTGIEELSLFELDLALRGHYIFGYLAYLSFFWFAIYYPNTPRKAPVIPLILTVVTLLFIAAIPFSNILFAPLSTTGTLASIVTFHKIGYASFILMLSGVFFLGLILLVRKLNKASIEERFKVLDQYQIYFAILANLLAGVLGITFNLILPLYGNFSFFYLNPILVTLALTGIGLYNLLKYNLFNAKVVLAEFFTAGIWIIFLARLLLATIIFGIFLIQSVLREVKIRQEVERLAKDLEKANVRLKELDRQKTEFVSIASHQLRSPLTAIKGYASLLLEDSFGKLPKEAVGAIKKIFDSSHYMAASIEDFLNVSRIELGTVKYDLKEVNISKLVKEVGESLTPAATDKHLEIRFVGKCDTPCVVNGDIGKLRQVVLNLIDNAIKYTPKGEIVVTVSTDKIKKVAQIAIKDSGVGIPSEVLPTLFKKFSRAKNANEVNVMGTGLGLFVAKQFVEAHKGRIWAESLGQGSGSTFLVELPLFEKTH